MGSQTTPKPQTSTRNVAYPMQGVSAANNTGAVAPVAGASAPQVPQGYYSGGSATPTYSNAYQGQGNAAASTPMPGRSLIARTAGAGNSGATGTYGPTGGYSGGGAGGYTASTGDQVGEFFGGGTPASAYQYAAGQLQGPNPNNYVIQGLPQYQGQVTQEGNNAVNYASGYGNAEQGIINNSNAYNNAFQSGNAYGAQQQQQAYNQMQNLANGTGPSLARANLLQGLGQQNAAIQSQAMSGSAGATGGFGNSQRNLLNAQAANANNVYGQANTASVAEQLGALSQLGSQANAMANSGLQSQQLNNSTQQGALSSGAGVMQGAQGMQMGGTNNAFQGSVAQTGANEAYDSGVQNYGLSQAGITLGQAQSGASAMNGYNPIGSLSGWLHGGSSSQSSDQNLKMNVSPTSSAQLSSFLGALSALNPGQGVGTFKAPSPQAKSQSGGGMNPQGIGQLAQGIQGLTSGSAPVSSTVAGTAGSAGYAAPAASAAMDAGGADAALTGGAALGADAAVGGAADLLPLLLLSDARTKTNVDSAPPLGDFLGKMKPVSYDYKPEAKRVNAEAPDGRNHGIMAQDLQRSEIGRDMVSVTPAGTLAVSLPKAVSASLASLAHIHQRLQKVERRRG